ncbi:protein C10-like [Tubulanus polymorphus]|uniref:protein C10-like n=1 Tax=Tubulanus polymorphus TaxID=672921 RepID=UPI003DA3C28D
MELNMAAASGSQQQAAGVSASQAGYNGSFNVEDGKCAIREILDAFKMSDNVVRLDEARDNAGNDMLRMMQIVFPVATKIQMDVISKYGFTPDGEGLIRFAQAIKMYEKQNEELAILNAELRAILIPQMDVPPLSLGATSPSKSQSAS